MDCVYCKLKSTNKWQTVYTSQIENGEILMSDIESPICPHDCCNAPAFFKWGEFKKLHAGSYHNVGCPETIKNGNRIKTHFVSTGEEINEDKILFENKAIYLRTSVNQQDEEENIDNSINLNDEDNYEVLPDISEDNLSDANNNSMENYDMVARYGKKMIGTPVGLYRTILKVGKFEQLMPDGRSGDDVLLDQQHLFELRKGNIDIDGQKKLIIATRAGTKYLKYELKIPSGFCLFKDAYAENTENAIFFLVKIKDAGYNDIFKKLVMGNQDERDPHNSILIYNEWKQWPHDFYKIYCSTISTSSYSFANIKHVTDKIKQRENKKLFNNY